MKMFYRWTMIFYFILFGIAIIQNYFMFLSWDISWLIQCANQLTHGGKYYKDFFETNPPMILYLYIPPVLISHVFHISIISVFKTYIFLMSLFCLAVCYFLFNKIFSDRQGGLKHFLTFWTVFLFFIFPVYDIGQREHLTVMLVLPYLLLAVLRAENRPISLPWKILVGMMGGIGFAIKPHFLIPLLMVEIYLMLRKRVFFSWVRIEIITMISVFLIYLISVFIITPEYFLKIVPLTKLLYLGSLQLIGFDLIFCQWSNFVLLISLGIYLTYREKLQQLILADILAISAVGFYLVYVLQHAFWFCHQIPAFSFSIFLAALVIFEGFKRRGFSLIFNLFFAAFLSGLIFLSLYERISFARYFYAEKLQPMIALFTQTHEKGHVYVFSSTVPTSYPLMLYAKVRTASRFPSFIFLPKLVECLSGKKFCQKQTEFLKEKREIIRLVVEDFKKNNPSLVMVDMNKEKPYFTVPFEYISFFSESSQFRKIWGQYRYLKTLNGYYLYQRK